LAGRLVRLDEPGLLAREEGVKPELVNYFGAEDGSSTGRIE
jgi:hypothetical protein